MIELVAILVILTIGLILLITFRPALTRTQGGKILAFARFTTGSASTATPVRGTTRSCTKTTKRS